MAIRLPSVPRRLTVVAAWVCVCLTATPVWGQTVGGTLVGRVRDQSAATLPYAAVSITNVATGVVTSVVTNADGFYSAPNLLPGTYDVAVAFDGFGSQTKTGITLNVGAELPIDFELAVGSLNENVQVEGQAATVDTVSATLRHNVSGTTIRELPLNGRDWTNLALLQPGVVGVGASGGTRSGNGMKMAVAGARPSENNYRLNGVGVNDYANTTPGNALGTNLGVEAVAEFSVLTNSYSAEYGRTSGGVVNAITRSGTNQIHGTVFEFHRNSAMDARDYFDRNDQPPPFRRNQFGVALGGPIVKNKTFFFGDYEGLRETLGQTSISTVPSAAAREGRLAAGPVTVHPQIARALALYPLPNGELLGNGDTGQYYAVRNKESRGDYALLKVDHNMSAAGRFNATFLYDDAQVEQPDALLAKQVADSSSRQLIASEYTHTFGPSVVAVTRGGLSRTESRSGQIVDVMNPALTDPSLGYIPGFNIGSISVPGLSGAGGGPGAADYALLKFTSIQASQDVYWLRGRHSLKFGFNVEHMSNDFDTPNLTGGSFNFGTMANFLRNVPSRFGALYPDSDTTRRMRETLIGGYVQDDFRLANTLTLNLGVRYEMMTTPTEVDGQVALLKSLTDPEVTVGGKIHDSNPTLKNFAPRLGVAWDPFGTRTTSIRAGVGIFDVLPFLYLFETPLNRSLPFFLQGNSTNPPAGSFPSAAYSTLSVQNLRTAWVDPNPPRAYRTQWNVDVQRQIGAWTAEVGYVGAKGDNLPLVERNMNTVIPTRVGDRWVYPPRSTSTVLNPNFSAINTTVSWNTESIYHGLQTALKRSLRNGLQTQVAYTWSKSIDTGSSISSVSSGTGYESAFAVATPLLPELARGPSNYDVRHNFVGSVVWEIPSSKDLNGFAGALAQGWQISGVYRAHSGYPFTLALNGDRAGSKADTTGSGLGQPPDLLDLPGCDSLVNPGDPAHYVKTECFAFPADGVLGTLGRNRLTSPGLATLDLVLTKTQKLLGTTAQFRIEMFNALNRANFSTPQTTIFDDRGNLTANVGVITSTRTSARQMQLGVKLLW
jgi:hypothetical protein